MKLFVVAFGFALWSSHSYICNIVIFDVIVCPDYYLGGILVF